MTSGIWTVLWIALFVLGGAGFIAALVIGIPLRLRGTSIEKLSMFAPVPLVVWIGYAIYWTHQGCGEGCVRDPYLLLFGSIFQAGGWALGVLVAAGVVALFNKAKRAAS